MRKISHTIERFLNKYRIKKKLYMLYIFCMVIPLIVTDSFIIHSVINNERVLMQHNMEMIANSVKINLSNQVDFISELAESIYMSEYIYSFLERSYQSNYDFFDSQYPFSKDNLLSSSTSAHSYSVKFYSENETIVNGGLFGSIRNIEDEEWYRDFTEHQIAKKLYFLYDDVNNVRGSKRRRILFVQRLDFYRQYEREKLVAIELDYTNINEDILKIADQSELSVSIGDSVVISNEDGRTIRNDYRRLENNRTFDYSTTFQLYGNDITIGIDSPLLDANAIIQRNIQIIGSLILLNILLPWIFTQGLIRSFVRRLHRLDQVMKSAEDENLIPIDGIDGEDEIAGLMENYNKMVVRLNNLIETVYKNRIKEQEIEVSRKNAELLALQSQINPHFLFNALESIRMHSILKQEYETAEMVESLAIIQRQHVDWSNDRVSVEEEIQFVQSYLKMQKYRFGDRISYEISVDEGLEKIEIPRLSIVTFVENACVHGIEGKSTAGWIFVRVEKRDGMLCIEVEDTGIGMSDDEIENTLRKMRNASIDTLKDQSHIGIINACLRLKMFCQNQVHFSVESEEGVGTLVQITMPIAEGEQLCLK